MKLGLPEDFSSYVARLAERRSRHRRRGLLVRVLFAVAGTGVLIAGIVMLVLPGPGLLMTRVGLRDARAAAFVAGAEHLLLPGCRTSPGTPPARRTFGGKRSRPASRWAPAMTTERPRSRTEPAWGCQT